MKKLAFRQPNISRTYSQSKPCSSGNKTKKGAIKIESNGSPLENQRTNNYTISEGPDGYKSVNSAISTHIWSNYSEEFFKLRNKMIGDIISESLT